MGSDAEVLVATDPDTDLAGAAALLAGAWAHIEVLEGHWSRFRPDSEISALNRHSGAPVVVSSDTIELVAHAIAAWQLTNGRFDPTVGATLVALGYDRDFTEMTRTPFPSPTTRDPGPPPAW